MQRICVVNVKTKIHLYEKTNSIYPAMPYPSMFKG